MCERCALNIVVKALQEQHTCAANVVGNYNIYNYNIDNKQHRQLQYNIDNYNIDNYNHNHNHRLTPECFLELALIVKGG